MKQSYARILENSIYVHRLAADSAIRHDDHAAALRHLAMAQATVSARNEYLRNRDPVEYRNGQSELRYLHEQTDLAEAFLNRDPAVQISPNHIQYERTAEALERDARAAERSAQQREAMEALLSGRS